ncbi:MAG: ABC transporter permease [Dehalococcoidia bacterium]|nr:ABC transporter permease [Dehalococcoidia bacterium]
MGQYLLRRVVLGAVTIWIVTMIVFTGLRVVVPLFYGDIVDLLTAEYGSGDPALKEQLREEYGLKVGVVEQYGRWVGGMLTGDIGVSLRSGRSILLEVRQRLPVSLTLGLVGLTASVFIAVPMGITAALLQNRWPDYALRMYAVGSSSVPSFWVAIMIIVFGSIWFRWAPPLHFAYLWEDPIAHIKIMLLPALLIGLTPSGGLVRIMRGQMLEVLRQDYVRTARSKGLTERAVVLKHALRNALIPIVTIIGLGLPGLVAGTALFEIIFVLPGMGNYLVQATNTLDYPVIQAINVTFALMIVTANTLVDMSYSFIDPRIRLR